MGEIRRRLAKSHVGGDWFRGCGAEVADIISRLRSIAAARRGQRGPFTVFRGAASWSFSEAGELTAGPTPVPDDVLLDVEAVMVDRAQAAPDQQERPRRKSERAREVAELRDENARLRVRGPGASGEDE